MLNGKITYQLNLAIYIYMKKYMLIKIYGETIILISEMKN